jgi:hypothetical protein
MTRKLCVFGQYASFFLVLENFFTVGFPTIIKLAFVLVRPLFRNVVRGMHCACTEVHEERLVWRDLFCAGNEGDGCVYQVFG